MPGTPVNPALLGLNRLVMAQFCRADSQSRMTVHQERVDFLLVFPE